MALTVCPACSKTVTDDLDVCPGCAAKIPAPVVEVEDEPQFSNKTLKQSIRIATALMLTGGVWTIAILRRHGPDARFPELMFFIGLVQYLFTFFKIPKSYK